MPSTCGSKKLNALTNKSCPNAKRAIEITNVQMYIVLEEFNMFTANGHGLAMWLHLKNVQPGTVAE